MNDERPEDNQPPYDNGSDEEDDTNTLEDTISVRRKGRLLGLNASSIRLCSTPMKIFTCQERPPLKCEHH